MKRIAKWLVGLILVLIVAASASINLLRRHQAHKSGPTEEWRLFEKREAEEAKSLIAQFHEDFNSGDFDAACEDSPVCKGPERFRRDWHATLQDVSNRFGKFKEVNRSEVTVVAEPFLIEADYYSSFEKGQVREIFRLTGRPYGVKSFNLLRIEAFQTAPAATSTSVP